jgi:hypothetical protein
MPYASTTLGPTYDPITIRKMLAFPLSTKGVELIGPPPLPWEGFTIYQPGLSLQDMILHPTIRRSGLLREQRWIGTCDWVMERPAPGYYQVQPALPLSEDMDYRRQLLLAENCCQRPCHVNLAAWTWLVHALLCGVKLLRDGTSRCRNRTASGNLLMIGSIGGRLSFESVPIARACHFIRLATVRTVPPTRYANVPR